MTTFDISQHAYVPILLTRRGERVALRESRPEVKDRMCPMFVVPPVPWDFVDEKPAKTLPDHIEPVASQLAQDWGTNPAYLDSIHLDDTPISGSHPIEIILKSAARLGLPLMPVTGPDRSAAHHTAVSRLAALPGSTGICLRLTKEYALNLEAPPGQKTWDLNALLTTLGVSPNDVDLIFDFGDSPDSPTATSILVKSIVTSLPHINLWRTITFSGTSMPTTFAGLPQQAVSNLPRTEWDTYLLLAQSGATPRALRFGDYAVQNPSLPSEVNPRFMRIFSQIRYSTDQEWLIARGQEVRVVGNAHVAPLAQLLVTHPDFAGANFSWGDKWIHQCANGALASTGNAETWRRAGTNHHIEQVVRQLSRLFGVTIP